MESYRRRISEVYERGVDNMEDKQYELCVYKHGDEQESFRIKGVYAYEIPNMVEVICKGDLRISIREQY